MSGFVIFLLFFAVCALAIIRPAWGVVGFYAFVLLDPAWNWRWALPEGFPFQKYIFYCIVLGFLLNGAKTIQLTQPAKRGLIALSVFLALAFISGTQTIDPVVTGFYLSILWKVVLAAMVAVAVIGQASTVRWLAGAAACGQGYNAFQINLDYFQTYFSRYAYVPWGSYGVDNNGYSIVTVPLFAVSLAFLLGDKQLWVKLLFGFIALLQLHQIMLMASRGCMLACIVVVGFGVLFMPRRKINFALVGFGLIAAIALAGPSVVEEFSSSFASSDGRDASAQSRFYLWQAGLRITADYPLLGVGPDAARRLVPLAKYYEGGLSTDNKALHNLFFELSTGMGVFALIAYLIFALIPVSRCYVNRFRDDPLTPIRLAVICGVPGYFVASLFSSGSLFESGYLLPVLGYCCYNVTFNDQEEESAFMVDD